MSSSSQLSSAVSPSNGLILSDTDGHYVGPIAVNDFMQNFVPVRSQQRPVDGAVFARVLKSPRGSTSISKEAALETFAKATRRLVKAFDISPGCTPQDVSPTIAVDVGLWPQQGRTSSGNHVCDLELFIDFNISNDSDVFVDGVVGQGADHTFERGTSSARTRRALHSRRVSALWSSQYRTHVFSINVFGRLARLLRWDATGIMVTEAFDYSRTPWLSEFFWRFDALTARERGHDTSVIRIDDPWPTHLVPHDHLVTLRDSGPPMSIPKQHRCFAVMKLPDRDNPTIEYDFIISYPPSSTTESPLGRSTRPLFGYDVAGKKLVFIKQYWRAVVEGQRKEGDIYKLLSEKGVRHLPAFGRGNDVRDYSSFAHDPPGSSLKGADPNRTSVRYRLYRMSLHTIGRSLTSFRSARELVAALRDAMKCHDDAYFKAGILHSDISVSNVMIDITEGTGFLTDWDLCTDVNLTQAATMHRRGTWRFMSFESLRSRSRPPSLLDDREAAFWVLVYVCLIYAPHKSREPLEKWLAMFDEYHVNSDGRAWGGMSKLQFLVNTPLRKSIPFIHSPILGELIIVLQKSFARRYSSPPMPLMDEFGLRRMDIRDSSPGSSDDAIPELEQEDYLVEILDSALKRGTKWCSVDDPATPHPDFVAKHPSLKRGANDAGLNDRPDPSKRHAHSGSLHKPSSPRKPVRKKQAVPPSDRVLRPRPVRVSQLDQTQTSPARSSRLRPHGRAGSRKAK